MQDKLLSATYLCLGLLFGFSSAVSYLIDGNKITDFTFCAVGLLLPSALFLFIGFASNCFSTIQNIGISLVFTGFLLIALVMMAPYEPHLAKFHGTGKVYLGFILIGISWFAFFPPNLGWIWRKNYYEPEEGEMVFKDGFGLEIKQPPKDPIDQAIWQLIHSNSKLEVMMHADPDLAGKIQSTFDYYNPRAGVFGSWMRRMSSGSRVKLLENLNQEQKLLIEQAAMLEKMVLEGKKRQVEHQMFIARNVVELMNLKNNAALTKIALDNEMLPEHWSAVRANQEAAKTRSKEEDDRLKREQEMEEKRLELRLREDEEKRNREQKDEEERHRREQEKQDQETKRKLDAARNFKRNEDIITDEMRQKRAKLLEEIEQIEADTTISDKRKAALKIDKENEAESLRRRIAARDLKAVSDEESFVKDI